MAKPKRIAAIDWVRGFVMVLMVVDHVSMAYNAQHNSSDSAALYVSGTQLPALEFFTCWISHLCAPVFVFFSRYCVGSRVERKVAKGIDGWQLDKDILLRGAFIALLDPTIISFQQVPAISSVYISQTEPDVDHYGNDDCYRTTHR